MKRFLSLGFCGMAILMALGAARFAAAAAAASTARPNFVFVLVDDLGWTDLGCYGSSLYETPRLDRLAEAGVRFTNAYAACPVCSPTRASIMTGKYPARVGITDWIPGSDPNSRKLLAPRDLHHLPLEEVTIAEALKQAGYATFFAGKWHLGGAGFLPPQQGFDINKGGHHRGSPPGGYHSPYKNPQLEDGPKGEYLPDRLTGESIRFMEGHRDTPFLVYLSFYTVHTPIQACRRHLPHFQEKVAALPKLPADQAERRERRGWTKLRQDNPAYASMVYAMDENVGRLLDAIDRLGLTGKTVVIFMSDNGGLSTLGRRRAPTSNIPLRAGKGWCYEGGIREPMIIRGPGIRSGDVCDAVVTSTDFYPTMLELAGLPPRPTQHVDGVSLVPLLRKGGTTLSRPAIFWHYPHYHGSTWAPGAAVRAGDWKLIEFYEEDRVELYNLRDDIGETHDLAETKPEKARELVELLHRWQEDVGAKMPRPNPAYRPSQP
jgi:arylsulfatase A-like enzyme